MIYELGTVYTETIANTITITLSKEKMDSISTGGYTLTVDIHNTAIQCNIPVTQSRYMKRCPGTREARLAFHRVISRIEEIESRIREAYTQDRSLMEEDYENFIRDLAIQELEEMPI